MTKAGCLAAALGALVTAPANAQQMTWTDKGFVNVNLGGQSGSRDLTTDSTFELYAEQGNLSTTQEVGGGALFDFSAGYKVWRNLALGMGYSRTGSDSDVAIAAAVPDPVFFDRLRNLTAAATGADHSENAFHIQGTWVMPVTDTLDVSFSAGPTIFNVSQDIPSAITVNEPGPTLASTTIVDASETTLGFHFGADVNYFFTPRFGAGLLARYSFGSVEFDVANDSISVGGFQIGAGLRYRF
ncbi:MAG: outer membrane protein [Vicinamibacterales bacterium]